MTELIPFIAFGGEGELLHFAHPNAYTPESFTRFLTPLAQQYRVVAMKQRPLWLHSKPTEMKEWGMFADDLIRFLDQEGLRNVIGVGHSLGGVATMLAAVKRPDLFSKLVLIEPVFMPHSVLQMVAAMSVEEMKQYPLVLSASYRRTQWSSRQEAFDRFRSKSVFSRFPDETLLDYVNHSIGENEDGSFSLLFPTAWEAHIYANFPQQVWDALPQVTQPMLGIRGAQTDTLMPEAWALWQKVQPKATFVEIADVGHMLPLERPSFVANVVLDYLR